MSSVSGGCSDCNAETQEWRGRGEAGASAAGMLARQVLRIPNTQRWRRSTCDARRAWAGSSQQQPPTATQAQTAQLPHRSWSCLPNSRPPGTGPGGCAGRAAWRRSRRPGRPCPGRWPRCWRCSRLQVGWRERRAAGIALAGQPEKKSMAKMLAAQPAAVCEWGACMVGEQAGEHAASSQLCIGAAERQQE